MQNKKYLDDLKQIKNSPTVEVAEYSQDYACGVGVEPLNYQHAKINHIDKLFLRELTPNITKIIMVRASGNSMEPLIKNNNIVFVDTAALEIKPTKTPVHSVFAFRLNSSLCIKQLAYNSNTNVVTASSLNSEEHEPFYIDLAEENDFQIIGRVLSVYNKV